MTKQICMFPVVVSALLAGRVADYLVEQLIPVHDNVYLQYIELFLGFTLAAAGGFMGVRIIRHFFECNNMPKLKFYLLLIGYSAIAGIGSTWVTDAFFRLVLVKYF